MSHLCGEGRKHLIGTQGSEVAEAQTHTHCAFSLSSGPASLTLWGLWKLQEEVMLLAPFAVLCPWAEVCQVGLGPS